MLSGNKGRLLRASNSMNTLKRRLGGAARYHCHTRAGAAARRRRRGAGPSRRRSDLAGLYESMLLSLSSCASVSHRRHRSTRDTTTGDAGCEGEFRV